MTTEISTAVAKLAAWYREHGESHHVPELEAALTDEWMTTTALVKATGKSRGYIEKALPYLHADGRAERRQAQLEKPIRRQTWQWEWRRPQPREPQAKLRSRR